jgi:hypothetical protein
LALTASVLGACGDGGGDSPSAAAVPTPTPTSTPSPAPTPAPSSTAVANHAPSIQGVPANSITAGSTYSFTPAASDTDGDILTFSITGRPSWATFDTKTGRLRGTPTAADVGTTSNIVVAVTDGDATVALAAFSIQVVGTATGAAALTWMPPTENDDGTTLTNLTGYKVYWGTSPTDFSNSITLTNPGLTSYVIDHLTPATWYFAASSLNADGVESDLSNVATKTVM